MGTVEERIATLEQQVQELQVELIALRGQTPDNVLLDTLSDIGAAAEKAVTRAKDAAHKAFDSIKAAMDKDGDGEA